VTIRVVRAFRPVPEYSISPVATNTTSGGRKITTTGHLEKPGLWRPELIHLPC
jgi:hypothetical protein